MSRVKVMSIFGTRPEAIKMCPLVLKLQNDPRIESIVCLTGQHREMLDQVMDIFGIDADYDLNIMRPRQTLTTITTDVLINMEDVLKECRPDIVLVHGDTTTSTAAALAAFYNRTLTGKIATYHFAPTKLNEQNLHNEGVKKHVYITGNTVIDAFQTTVKENFQFITEELKDIGSYPGKLVLLTAHRRENLGEPLANICRAVRRLAEDYPDIKVVYPVHLNPRVRETAFSILGDTDRVVLIDPIDVEEMHNLMARSYLVMTDSGGLQEEAPSCGVPVLVLRTETERPEAVEAGTVKVVGVDEDTIYNEAVRLLTDQESYDRMAKAVNPYGDGHASERIVARIIEELYH